MDVHLLTYDLSGGLARQMSMSFLGFQLDAIYHTSIELDGVEYVYDGGINTIKPGSSHLGRPMERLHLGTTELPIEVILEYVDSLRSIFTPAAYDLFRHNCNNFSNDFATFLVGKGIPAHISNMPQAVLDSPFGKMLQPQLESMVQTRKAQQGGLLGIQSDPRSQPTASSAKPVAQANGHSPTPGVVRNVSNLQDLNVLLEGAQRSCAVVFFTSATCPPCKILYPLYDQLAAEMGDQVTLIKVDISQAFDIGQRYGVRATPTFATFLQGKEQERWSGADSARLRSTVRLLVDMAHPRHPHESLRLPHFADPRVKLVSYTKMPPLEKLVAKMATADPAVVGVKNFIETREKNGPAQSTLPEMQGFSAFMRNAVTELPVDVMFAVVDLFRCALIDPRVSGYYAEEVEHRTVATLLNFVNSLGTGCPYALRLVTLQMACNVFTSPLYPEQILAHSVLRDPVIQLVSTSFLDDSHNNVRVAAASLLFNIAVSNNKTRDSSEYLPESDQVELAASVLEAITQESSSSEALQGMLLALGYLVYRVPMESELVDLLRTMDAQDTVLAKAKDFPKEDLVKEVGSELLAKGLRRK
ncbi:hypothetical protein JX265_012701 [Neoarthrinium moseri]|uniref:Thioredoxin n=1 Tax=Neoarthrinium moseri TaxID=1658444 RepID=A0A9P9WA10_9PEZI|nr:hypothetical protein JX265_012701 [Neoarthrinium moseri]